MVDFINFKTLKRPPKPNTFLVAPEHHCLAAEPDQRSPVLSVSAAELFETFRVAIASNRRWGSVTEDETNWRMRFVATTGLMRFKDDVDIQVIALKAAHSTFAIYSRSRVGYSDLGANRKRVQELIGKVTTN
ncbi:MAG: DUF1499 domain-containing protein [Pseudomonadota bacterium]